MHKSRSRHFITLLSLFALAVPVSLRAASSLTLISRSPEGGPALTGAGGEAPTISGDGRWVTFLSNASNFGAESNGWQQVFVRDRNSGSLTLASRSAAGEVANRSSFRPVISRNGRYVAFHSYATNLGSVPTGPLGGYFVRDLSTQQTELIAPLSDDLAGSIAGGVEVAITGDGRYVAFASYDRALVPGDTNNSADVFVKDRVSGVLERVSLGVAGTQGNAHSGLYGVSISDDGRYISFNSIATNLVGGDTNGIEDIFVRDRVLGTTERISLSVSGSQLNDLSRGGSLSADGRYVAFSTAATLDEASQASGGTCVRDRQAQITEIVSVDAAGAVVPAYSTGYPSISRDGRYVLFDSVSSDHVGGDTNGVPDVFLRDRIQNTTERISRGSAGTEPDFSSRVEIAPAVSDSGQVVVYTSNAMNLVAGDTNGRPDVFARVRSTQSVERISAGLQGQDGTVGAGFGTPVVSADGQWVVFASDATNLVLNDTNLSTDLFAYNRSTGVIERVNVSSAGAEVPFALFSVSLGTPAISADGRFIAFASGADNLVPGDTNHVSDVFVRDRVNGTTERVNLTAGGGQDNWGTIGYGASLAISADGRFVAFPSASSILVANDTNNGTDIFVRDRWLGTTERVSLAFDGTQPNTTWEFPELAMSADGQVIAFTSFASNLVPGDTNGNQDIFVRDRANGTIQKVPAAVSGRPKLSADGRLILFNSIDSNLVTGDTNGSPDLFLWDRVQNQTQRVSLTPGGGQLAVGSFQGAMSADARYIAYSCQIQVNAELDQWEYLILRHDREQSTVEIVSTTAAGGLPNSGSTSPSLSGNGSVLAFVSSATNLVSSDPDPNSDVYVRVLGAPSLAAPSNLAAVPVSSSSVKLTWDDLSAGETGFAVERLDHGSYQVIGTAAPDAEVYVDASGLQPLTTYSYRVRACDDNGFSAYTAVASATTLPLAPSAPSAFTASVSSQTAVQLSWMDTSDNEQGFTLVRAVGSGEFQALTNLSSNTSIYIDASVAANTSYRYSLRAYNAGGQSEAVEATATTLPNAPAAPSGLLATVRSLTSIRLNWQDSSSNESGFRVERRSGTGLYAVLATVNAGVTEYVDTTVAADTAYQYRIIAFNVGGDSASSEVPVEIETGGKLKITPARLNFGTVKRGKVKQLKLTLKNEGKVAIAGEIVSLTLPYRVVEGGGAFTLEPKKSRKVTVEFAPSVAGLVTRTLQITSTSDKAVDGSVSVSGRGK